MKFGTKIDETMKAGISAKVFPASVLLVSEKGNIRFFRAYGQTDIYSGERVRLDTIFDLASLTKPLVTTIAVILLIQEKKLQLDYCIGDLMPCFKNTDKAKITIRNLLLHDSGLPDYLPCYKRLQKIKFEDRSSALLDMIVKQPLEYSPGEKSIYSDIGFMILGYIVQCVSGERLDHYVHERVFRPLGLEKIPENLFFVDLSDRILAETIKKKYRFAATEDCPWRKKILKGEVHDDNAHVMGGIAGHAGLFGTAEGIHTLLRELDLCFRGDKKSGLFEKKWIERFFERNEKYGRTLGFDCPSAQGSASGRYFSKASVGHLGFTGVSFWMDMDKSVIIILLSNRVHPFRENSEIKKFRPLVHDIIMEELFY